jgi:hypothetical protein
MLYRFPVSNSLGYADADASIQHPAGHTTLHRSVGHCAWSVSEDRHHPNDLPHPAKGGAEQLELLVWFDGKD